MAEECLIDNKSVGEIPLKRKFQLPMSRWVEILREDRIRRREEEEEGEEDSDDDEEGEGDEEIYKKMFRYETKCYEKPCLGHEAWLEYRDYLATQKAAAAAATSVCRDDVDAPGPKKKLKVNEQEALEGSGHETTPTQEDNNNSHSMHVKVWTRMLLMNKGNDPIIPQDSAKASGMDKQIKVTLG